GFFVVLLPFAGCRLQTRTGLTPAVGVAPSRGSRQARHGCLARESGQDALTERRAIPGRQDAASIRSCGRNPIPVAFTFPAAGRRTFFVGSSPNRGDLSPPPPRGTLRPSWLEGRAQAGRRAPEAAAVRSKRPIRDRPSSAAAPAPAKRLLESGARFPADPLHVNPEAACRRPRHLPGARPGRARCPGPAQAPRAGAAGDH